MPVSNMSYQEDENSMYFEYNTFCWMPYQLNDRTFPFLFFWENGVECFRLSLKELMLALNSLMWPGMTLRPFKRYFWDFIVMCFWVFAWMYVCILYTFHVCRGRKRLSDPLGLESQMTVSRHVGAGNWTLVTWKSSQCSIPLSYFSTSWPCTIFLFPFETESLSAAPAVLELDI